MGLVTSIKSGLYRFLEWLDRESKAFVILVAVLLDVLIGLLDHLTGYEISFSLFYLIPVALISRTGGRTEGFMICVLCAATWLVADIATGHEYVHVLIPYWNAVVRLGFFLAVNVSLASMRRSMKSLEELSKTDPLTGAANRRGFCERVQLEIDRSLRHGHAITMAYMDVDNFKEINDRFGHSVGDQVLAQVALVTARGIRKTDFLGRLGGDEFAILFPETDPEFAPRVLKRIKDSLSLEMQAKGWPVTFSGGAVTFTVTPNSVDEIIRAADNMMYLAKSRGKDTLTFATFPERDQGV
jgi:diguanylate cyclase (GGDEF)-like protein